MQNIKLVVVGDGGVGKSVFLMRATSSHFPRDWVPTVVPAVLDNYTTNLELYGSLYSVSLWDTAGQEDYDRLRPLSYPQTDVFVVCFDVANRSSFQNVTEKWIPELRHFVPEAPVLLLATKTDLRVGNTTSIVSTKEGNALATSLGVSYAECSSLTTDGVQPALNKALKLPFSCTHYQEKHSKLVGFFERKNKNSVSVKDEEPLPPYLPPAGLPPHVEILSSSFASYRHSMMSDTSCADVRFLFADNQSVEAHKTVLTAASSIFKNIFFGRMTASHESFSCIFENISWVCDKESNCPNLVHVEGQCQNKGKTVIRLHESISKGVFVEVLAFLYTGSLEISKDEDKNFVKEIQVVAEKFELAWLTDICSNILKGDSYLNSSIGTWLNDNTGQAAKEMLLNKPLLADVKFCVKGIVVHGHKVILKARSEVMAAMLGGAFRESDMEEIEIKDASLQSFLALLEYFYTDHAPIEEGNSVEIMILADRFCLPRLVTLCELYITKKMDASIQERIADCTSDVINLLLTSQAHNAKQLSGWCLHFISTNFSVFESTEEFDLVQGENREHVYEHRGPPLSEKVRASKLNSKCKVM